MSLLFLICSLTSTSAQNKKVVILDSLQSKKIIIQLEQGDFARAELTIYKRMDTLSQKRIEVLKTANFSLLDAFNEKQLEVDKYKEAVKVQDKIIQKEKNKKNFYKISTIVSIVALLFFIN